VIAISDTGARVSDEHRARIFDPLFITPHGARQGLAIARTIIVEQHGGGLTLESGAAGGATVVVRLPVAVVEQHAAA
jgi:signal transduction histidine kinase